MYLADSAGSGGAVAAAIFFLVIGAALYFVPGIVASARHVPNQGSVWIINVLLGWTLVGWAVALAMACRSRYQAVMTPYQYPGPGWQPPPPPPGFRPPPVQPQPQQPGIQQYGMLNPDTGQRLTWDNLPSDPYDPV